MRVAGLLRAIAASGCLLWGTAPAAQADATPAFPTFDVEPCCQLCPAAANPAAYSTPFLRSFKMLVQGTGGWLFRSEDDLMTAFGPDEQGLRSLVRMRKALRRQGVELVIVMQPPRGLMHKDRLSDAQRQVYNAELAQFSYARALQRLREAGFVVPDLERLVYEGGRDSFFFRSDHHWTPEGARRTAEVVAERVKQMPEYQALPRKRFVTRRAGLLGKNGTMDSAAQRLCGYDAPRQYVQSYVTELEGETDASGLLGEPEPPPITLIGTSNSDPAYNFAGFLQELLEVDILNAAIAGGGLDGAPLSYLPSEEFREHPPKILIWELEPYHNLSDDMFYRRVIPVIEGGCDARPASLSAHLELKNGRNEVLFNGGGEVLDLRAGDQLLDLRFSNPVLPKLQTVVWYTNGRKDEMSIEPDNLDSSGRFLTELRQDQDYGSFTFLSLDLNAENLPPGTTVEARLCNRRLPPATITAQRSEP
ncbi:MAG: alginate O-acetyltransferase [Pseudomonadota bacterium]